MGFRVETAMVTECYLPSERKKSGMCRTHHLILVLEEFREGGVLQNCQAWDEGKRGWCLIGKVSLLWNVKALEVDSGVAT